MECPKAHGPLLRQNSAGVQVEVCPVCSGEWLGEASLRAIETTAVSDEMALAGMIEYFPHPSELHCPACGDKMIEFDYRGNPLQLDACGKGHGYWLDGGEKQRVQELVRQRARDLHRSATAEGSFAGLLDKLRGQLGGRGRSSR